MFQLPDFPLRPSTFSVRLVVGPTEILHSQDPWIFRFMSFMTFTRLRVFLTSKRIQQFWHLVENLRSQNFHEMRKISEIGGTDHEVYKWLIHYNYSS